MRVILKKKVKDLGDIGDDVIVAAGYAENFLIPNSFATRASEKEIAWAENQRAKRIAKKAEIIKKAKEFAKKLEDIKLSFTRKTTKEEGTHLFGAVAEKDIMDELKKEAKIELEKKQIKMEHIKETGEYEVEIHLAEDVNAKVKVEVKAE